MIISRAHIDLYPIIAAGRRAHKTAQTTCQEVLTRRSSSSSSCPLSLKRITFAVWIWNLAQTPRWCLNAKFQNPPLRNVMFVVNTENLCECSKFWVSFQSVFPVKYHFLPKKTFFFTKMFETLTKWWLVLPKSIKSIPCRKNVACTHLSAYLVKIQQVQKRTRQFNFDVGHFLAILYVFALWIPSTKWDL